MSRYVAQKADVREWFDDPRLVRQFPSLFMLHAVYCRLVAWRDSGFIRGGSFALRMVTSAQRLSGAQRDLADRLGARRPGGPHNADEPAGRSSWNVLRRSVGVSSWVHRPC
jgi:hypothetical protein